MIDTIRQIFGSEVIKLNNRLSVDIDVFAQLFGICESFTYAELKRVDEENGYGYGKFIEEWKEKGLIE